MTTITISQPPIVSRDQWLAECKKLLTKHYVFDGPNGKPSLKDLFEGRRQLINVQATLQLVVTILISDILTDLSQQSVPFGTANLDPM